MGFKKASEVKRGDKLKTARGTIATVTSVKPRGRTLWVAYYIKLENGQQIYAHDDQLLETG